jgi:hypothetical protein
MQPHCRPLLRNEERREVADQTIEIPGIEMSGMLVTIEGVTPLITHRFGERARRLIEEKQQKKASQAKPPRNPQEEFEDALYEMPSENGPGSASRPPA